MLYEEFLKLTHIPERHITHDEYTEVIEPMYMKSTLDKEAFCEFMSVIYNSEEPTIEICRTMINAFKEPTSKKLKTYRCLADCAETDISIVFYVAAYNVGEATALANNQIDKEKDNYQLINVNEVLPLKEEAKKVLTSRLLEENEKIKED